MSAAFLIFKRASVRGAVGDFKLIPLAERKVAGT
jgi:hypothetical protein